MPVRFPLTAERQKRNNSDKARAALSFPIDPCKVRISNLIIP